ncbi:PilW family protein [Pseudomonadota bacterium]
MAGMTLLELMIALGLAGLLILGVVQIASAAASSTRLQRNQAQMQENARLAMTLISRHVREAGYDPRPWDGISQELGLIEGSADSTQGNSDRLVVRSWSDLNCFDNRNPELDPNGNPAFFIRESFFDLNSSHGLTWECRYGPSPAELVTQVRRQGIVQNVDSFQVLLAEDLDQDSIIDGWTRAGYWNDESRILGVRVGLLLSSEDPLSASEISTFKVLDALLQPRADGRLRRVFDFAVAIRGTTG